MPTRGMTVREEQIALSHRMLDAMENRNIALCDAGTGIGKTYAYLTAGIAFMSERDRDGRLFQPVLISTSSIALQNAVLNEYLPFLTRILMADGQIRNLIAALKAEKCTAAATNLQKAAVPLLTALENPDGDREFSAYAKHLALLDRALSVIRSAVQDRATPLVIRRLKELARTVTYLLEESNQMVRYVSVNETGEAVLCATVTNLGVRLAETMWERPCPYILTSGTMAVGPSFQRFREEAGLAQCLRVKESVSLSPFDYEENCRLYLPVNPVSFTDPQYYDKLSADIAALITASNGHALVLFTSYAAMSAVKERLLLKNLPWPIFTLNHNANYTVEQFRRSPGAVLLATGAAWEGFDFPGDAVSMLIIPRLPFPLPDAVKEAERERYDTLRDYIRAVIVPEMQIKLKQGFGRAIRTETDTCAVAILDERACAGGRYHEDVLSALPEMRRADTMRDIEDYIRSVKSEQYFTEGNEKHGEERERGLLRSPQSA